MVHLKRSLTLHVKVPVPLQLVELANNHLLTCPGQLDGGQLLLIVSFKRRRNRRDYISLVGCQGLHVCWMQI